MQYLMESSIEAERLLAKGDEETSRHQLKLSGLRNNMTAIDAGGGAGFVSKIMTDLVGPHGKVVLLDQSVERIKSAKKFVGSTDNFECVETELESINLPDEVSDYTWCRFVFEYLKDPSVVMKELVRITKRGGKIVVGDLDHNMLNHYPMPKHLESHLHELVGQLQTLGLWDPYAGRKLYSLFSAGGLSSIRVHMMPHHLIYGESSARDFDNWNAKWEQMVALAKKGVLKLSFNIESARQEFNAFFKNPERFSYTPLILVEGFKR